MPSRVAYPYQQCRFCRQSHMARTATPEDSMPFFVSSRFNSMPESYASRLGPSYKLSAPLQIPKACPVTPTMLTSLPYDVICEVLAYLSVPDILRVRRVCKWLSAMTYERAIWCAVYERATLLRPHGPRCSHSSPDLEKELVRSTKLSLRWKDDSKAPPPFSLRCLADSYPMFSFEAAMVAGRYLLTAESKRVCLYDLDAPQGDGLESPMPTQDPYWQHKLNVACGMLCHQMNDDTLHVAFTQNDIIVIVKIRLWSPRPESEIVAEIPAQSVVKMCLSKDYLFFIEDFTSPPHPARLYHIPSRRLYKMPMHDRIYDPLDLEDVQVHITESHLFVMYLDALSKASTSIEAFELPKETSDCGEWLRCSHTGQFPLTMAVIEFLNRDGLGCNSPPTFTIFALQHDGSSSSLKSSSQADVLEVILSSNGKMQFNSVASTPVNIDGNDLRQTKLFSSSRAGACLAVSCTLACPTYQSYHIQYSSNGKARIETSTLCPPDPNKENRHIIGFDGFRGRLCWVRGWCPSTVHIIDYA